MRGVLFTELIELMEDLMGLEVTNKVLEEAHLENGGAYTAVGSYPSNELFKLLDSLNRQINSNQEKLLISYGEYFFYRTSVNYPEEVKKYKSTFSLLQQLPQMIEKEIRKLEPNAVLPLLEVKITSAEVMSLHYISEKKKSYFLEGIILACIGYFQEPISLQREDQNSEGKRVRFQLLKKTGHE